MLRLGLFISPAINVTLFQLSLLKIEPTIECCYCTQEQPPMVKLPNASICI